MQREFVIWSIENQAWWRPRRCGYTVNLEEAGVYWEREANEILQRANYVKLNEALVPLECVRTRTVGLGVGPL